MEFPKITDKIRNFIKFLKHLEIPRNYWQHNFTATFIQFKVLITCFKQHSFITLWTSPDSNTWSTSADRVVQLSASCQQKFDKQIHCLLFEGIRVSLNIFFSGSGILIRKGLGSERIKIPQTKRLNIHENKIPVYIYTFIFTQVISSRSFCGKHTLTRGSKMPQKAGCTGSNKVSDCCNYI